MSKLIVEMDFPKNECSECRLKYKRRGYGGVFYCFNHLCVDKFTYGRTQNGDRPDWCPIKGELVRCGRCYYKEEKRIMDEDVLWCRKHHMYVTADWFCADGDRK